MQRLVAIALAVGICNSPCTAQVAVARYKGPLDTSETRWTNGLRYDPVDLPLQWRSSSELLIAHLEGYSFADVGGSTCGGTGIFRVAPNGRGTATPLAVGQPACDAIRSSDGLTIDPEGRWIVYSVHVPVNSSRLVRLELGTTRADTLPTSCTVDLRHPSISPDAQRVAVHGLCRRNDEEYNIYLMRADDSTLRPLNQPDGFSHEDPAWSPDGARLTFTRVRSSSRHETAQIAMTDTSGRSMRVLAAGYYPAWSPDGHWIAFLATDPSVHLEHAIHLIRPDGSGERVVFLNRVHSTYSRGWGPMPEGSPTAPLVWSPDGAALAFSRRFDRGTSVWRLDLASGRVTPITAPGAP
jgi:dipeptidyl aminopeptidase/acylaminoacyl peptidase